MMGHKICFYGNISIIIPKLSLLLLIWSSVQGFVKSYSTQKISCDSNFLQIFFFNFPLEMEFCNLIAIFMKFKGHFVVVLNLFFALRRVLAVLSAVGLKY